MSGESEPGAESSATDEVPRAGLRQQLLTDVGGVFSIGVLKARREGQEVTSQVIGIAELEGSVLVAVPHSAWNRVVARRHLPARALSRATLVEVTAAADENRAEAHPVWRVKVWVGLLSAELHESVEHGREDGAAEMVFVVAGSGATAAGPVPACPLGSSLLAVASEHFAFVSAQEEEAAPSVAASNLPERMEKVESVLDELKQSMSTLLQRLPEGEPEKQRSDVGRAAPPRPSALKPRKEPVTSPVPLPGLDPAVVEAARSAGVPEDQLRRMSHLTQGARNLAPEPRGGAGNDPLEDEPSEEEEADGPEGTSDPLKQAVLKMSRILDALHQDKKASNLEDLLDKADGGDASQGSTGGGRSKAAAYNRLRALLTKNPQEISRSIEGLMAEDFLLSQSGPGQEGVRCTVRGWIEHRSLLQSFPGPIRNAWLLGGIVDAINNGETERAKAMALLGVAALDQAAIDGSWIIAAEVGLERSPPFSSFARPRVLDSFEAKQTKVLDPRWMGLLMSRLKERDSFHTAKRNLAQPAGSGQGAQGSGAPLLHPSGSEGAEGKGLPPKGGRGRAGKGKEKDRTKEGDK